MRASLIGITAIVAIAAPILMASQSAAVIIRNRDGSAACVIVPGNGAGQMSVLVRGPANPPAELVPRLPADRRDFSGLPVRVVLLSATGDGTPHERRPTAVEALSEYPVIDSVPSTVPFTRVRFPRAWLVAGNDHPRRPDRGPVGQRPRHEPNDVSHH
jgi:hypothetical protein